MMKETEEKQSSDISSTSGSLYLQMQRSLCQDVVKHYINCPDVKNDLHSSKVKQLQSVVYPHHLMADENHPEAHYIANESSSFDEQINVWRQRKRAIENISEMHLRKQQEYIEELRLVTAAVFNNEDAKLNTMKTFIRKDVNDHWDNGLFLIMR